MAQGRFTKQEAEETSVSVEELFGAIPKTRRLECIGHLNNILLFLSAAKKAAPDEEKEE